MAHFVRKGELRERIQEYLEALDAEIDAKTKELEKLRLDYKFLKGKMDEEW